MFIVFLLAIAWGMYFSSLRARGWTLLQSILLYQIGVIVISAVYVLFTIGLASADEATAKQTLRASTLHLANGSGSVVKGKSGKNYILTNWHVYVSLKYKGDIFGSFEDGKVIKGPIRRESALLDLCASEVDSNLPALRLGKAPRAEDTIYTRGYPAGILSESSGKIKGVASWEYLFPIEEVGQCPSASTPRRGFDGNIHACQMHYTSTLTSLYSRPGSSGSPVVDNSGNIIGVISSWHQDEDYDAGMVSYSDLKQFLDTL